MGELTGIAWTDHTHNSWWGCTKISPGCEHCYADTFAKRVGHGVRLPTIWGPRADRQVASEKVWRDPLKWNAAALRDGVRRRVFTASMSDVFEDRPDLIEPRDRLLALVEATPGLDWQLLTKRPENMVRLTAHRWSTRWPANAWAGTTCEDQANADRRIPHLLAVPAAVRFVSYEPALGPVDFTNIIETYPPHVWTSAGERTQRIDALQGFDDNGKHTRLDWVIVGGESGPGARGFDVQWARSVVEQCKDGNVACFVKQLGTWPFDSRQTSGEPAWWKLRGKGKGDDMDTWPDDLRVREFPAVSNV